MARKKKISIQIANINGTDNGNVTVTEMFKSVKIANKRVDAKFFKNERTAKESNPSPSLTMSEMQEILREFDLNVDYGPILGITRTARFKRAILFDIPVKNEVFRILSDQNLLKHFPQLNLNIWHGIEAII